MDKSQEVIPQHSGFGCGSAALGLYIHIPFCEKKCAYCAFFSISKPWKNEAPFFQALESEIKNLPADFSPETIFVGGGTPTAPDFQTLEAFFPILGKFGAAEFSVEANPGTVDSEKLELLKESGVNRLSIGVQSFNVHCLETLGRIYSAAAAEGAFRQARAAGFDNISIDLMFGIPGQTMDMLESDLDRVLASNPEHISIYNLMFEEGTPLADRRLVRLDEELEREMYDMIRARLRTAGFGHYEISNFAKTGFECRHNRLYWTGGEYIGCGPSAHSHWKGTRWANVADLDDYCRIDGSVGDVALPVQSGSKGRASLSERAARWPGRVFEETLEPQEKERETLVMGLRLLDGIEVSSDLWEELEPRFRALEQNGLLKIDGQHVRLSEEALFVSDAVFSELV
jgi:oxygen-independent coproporphyrinogen III oxidase